MITFTSRVESAGKMLSSMLNHQRKQQKMADRAANKQKLKPRARTAPPKPPSPKRDKLVPINRIKTKINKTLDPNPNPISSFYSPEPPKKRPLPSEDGKRTGKGTAISKTIMRYMFSHVGLCFLIIGYCMLGGLIFQKIEEGPELDMVNETYVAAQEVEDFREDLKLRLKSIPQNKNMSKELIKSWLDEYQAIIQMAISNTNGTYSGSPISVDEAQIGWNFPGALLFAVSIISLIGYGHVTPNTELGQIVVILYALLGVPLTLMFLANIGQLMADIIRMSFHRGCCKFCKQKRRDTWAGRQKKMSSMTIGTIVLEDCDDEALGFRSVPMTLPAGIMVIYVAIGTLLFVVMDGWSGLEATYFAFTTIATIGFGDYIPGWHETHTIGKLKMVVSSFYIILGMAVLSMAFNLIVEVFFRTAYKTGEKLGIKLDDEEEKADDPKMAKSNLNRAIRRNKIV